MERVLILALAAAAAGVAAGRRMEAAGAVEVHAAGDAGATGDASSAAAFDASSSDVTNHTHPVQASRMHALAEIAGRYLPFWPLKPARVRQPQPAVHFIPMPKPPRFTLPVRRSAALPEVEYEDVQHTGVLVADLEASRRFYLDVLGFKDDTQFRPETLPYPGAFMRAGPRTQVHLMKLPNPDPTDLAKRPEYAGRDRHTAIRVKSIAPLKARLDAAGVNYRESSSGRPALFLRDLDGNGFEFMEPPAALQALGEDWPAAD